MYAELLQEHEVNGQNHAHEGCEVIPLECFATEACHRIDGKYHQSDNLLNNLQLEERKWATIATETKMVSRNHKAILHQRKTPGNEDNDVERSVAM